MNAHQADGTKEDSGLPRDTCLQCEQTRAQVKTENAICGIEGGYEYRELEAEWPQHHWRDWSDAELPMILPQFRHLYRRVAISGLQYAACEHRARGHNPAKSTIREYGIIAGECTDCGHDTTKEEAA